MKRNGSVSHLPVMTMTVLPVDFGLTALKVTWDDRYRLIGHRDVLGALMGLGIDRAVLGDILMQGRGARLWQTVPWRNGLSGIS